MQKSVIFLSTVFPRVIHRLSTNSLLNTQEPVCWDYATIMLCLCCNFFLGTILNMFSKFQKNTYPLLLAGRGAGGGDVCPPGSPSPFLKPTAPKNFTGKKFFRKKVEKKIIRQVGGVPPPFPPAGLLTEWPVAIRFVGALRALLDRLAERGWIVWGRCPHTPGVFRFLHNEDRKIKIRHEVPICFSCRTSCNRLHRAAASLRLHSCRALSPADRHNLNTALEKRQGEKNTWQFLLPAR